MVMADELAGTLNERVEIMRWIGGRDATGAASGYWQPISKRYASIFPESGPASFDRGSAARSIRRWRVVLRHDCSLSIADQLRWRGLVLNVLAVENDPRAPELSVLRCESRQP